MMNLAQSEYKGDKDFEKFLIEIEAPVSIFEVRSYLLGILIGLENVPPSWVIEELLLIGVPDGFQFKNLEDAETFHQKFFSLWNDLIVWQNSTLAPKLAAIPKGLSDDEIKFPIHVRQMEKNYFLVGLSESDSMSLQETNEKFDKAIFELEEIGDELMTLEDILMEGGNSGDISLAKKMLKDSEDVFNKYFPVISQEIYKERMKGRR